MRTFRETTSRWDVQIMAFKRILAKKVGATPPAICIIFKILKIFYKCCFRVLFIRGRVMLRKRRNAYQYYVSDFDRGIIVGCRDGGAVVYHSALLLLSIIEIR